MKEMQIIKLTCKNSWKLIFCLSKTYKCDNTRPYLQNSPCVPPMRVELANFDLVPGPRNDIIESCSLYILSPLSTCPTEVEAELARQHQPLTSNLCTIHWSSAQITAEMATESQTSCTHEQDPRFLERVGSLPIVTTAIDQLAQIYQYTKGTNAYVKYTLETAEAGVKSVTQTALPVMNKLEKPSKFV